MSRTVSVMQGAEGMGKGCQLVSVCDRKECRKRAGRPAREQLRKLAPKSRCTGADCCIAQAAVQPAAAFLQLLMLLLLLTLLLCLLASTGSFCMVCLSAAAAEGSMHCCE